MLNAHYTSPVVIRAIYEAIEKMGFTKGNILEPSMGVGNFFGMLPQGMSESNLYGIELDSISGRIAKQLYRIKKQPMENMSSFKKKSEKCCSISKITNISLELNPIKTKRTNDITAEKNSSARSVAQS